MGQAGRKVSWHVVAGAGALPVAAVVVAAEDAEITAPLAPAPVLDTGTAAEAPATDCDCCLTALPMLPSLAPLLLAMALLIMRS